MVLRLLRPADQEAAKAVEPGVGALDDPTAGAPARVAPLELGLLAPRADVRGEAVLERELVDLRVVVALVEAEAVGPLRARLRALDQDARERAREELEVVDVRAADLEPDRDAAALADERAFRPLLALSVGLGPVCSPPSGALPSAPSQQSQAQSIPFEAS